MRFRVVDLDPDHPFVEQELVLSAFNYDSKENGWFTDRLDGNTPPQELVFGPYGYNRLDRADDRPTVVTYSRESFQEYPEVWTARLDLSRAELSDMRRLSETNPQQDEFSWGSARLVEWTSLDGQSLDGILYTPEGFDASKTYPMMVYFYEKSSDGLFNHYTPSASRASIDRAFYVSRGYVLFVPDIPYKVGYPGESAMNAVMPGITSLIEAGFVDRDRIGVQGHSWGGYQIAYMVTQTNLFAAAEAGAPVVNMTSAYGGIRWGSGMSRMFQYERTQSRIGGTLWDAHQRYIANSPLFEADKVETPLLMMHNDADGAVPWYQGIEYFVALRRLGKPVWLLNYNDQDHGLSNLHDQRDWSIRMQQFFDHYLMDAPAPVWLEHGIPAVEKGRTLGLEPAATVPSDGSAH
jgi:dipeptidyl aminopeptidase/acylaminoacyl peptidase